MKQKLLLTLVALFSVIGAWAQTQVTALNTSKYYTLACSSTGHDATKVCLADVNGTIVGRSTSNTFFQFEAGESDGQYYIKSVASNKYVVASGTADGSKVSLSDNKDTYWTVAVTGTALYIRPNESTNTYLNNNMGDSPNLKIASGSGDCSKWKVCEYSAPINVSSTNGYKLKLKNTDYYLKFNTSYSETNAVNATTASTSGSVFRINFATSGSKLQWRNEYMKTAGSYGWNSGHGTDATNSTWKIVPVDGEENTYYLMKGESGDVYFGQRNSVNEGDYFYTNVGSSASYIKWQLEEVSMTECMQENGYWPQTSTSDAPKYYTIKSTHCNKYAKYNGDSEFMALIDNRLESTANAFWFEQVSVDNDVLGVKIHNVQAEKCVAAVNSFTDEGITWYLKADVSSTKPSIAINSNATTWDNNGYGWNNYQGTGSSIHTWASTDGGSSWWLDRISDDEFTAMQAIYTHQTEQLKEQATTIAKSSSVLFGDWNENTSAAGIALAAISSVSMDNTENAWNSATTTINNALKTMYAAANDKKVVFFNDNRNNKYMVVVDAVQLAGADAADGRSVFQVNYVADSDGQFTIKNLATGRYIANTPAMYARVQLSTEAGKFTIKSFGTNNKFAFICVSPSNSTHNSLHLDGGFNVVPWEADQNSSASVWIVQTSNITDEELTSGENAVKQQAYTKAANVKPSAELFGEGLGKYTKNDAYNTTEATIDAKSNDLDFESILALENTIKNQLSACLNMPQGGTFLRLKGGVSNKYVDANAQADQTNRADRIGMSESTEAGSIWYLDENKRIISYSKGYFIKEICDHSGTTENASTFYFRASDRTNGRYGIYNGSTRLYDNGSPADRLCADRQGAAANQTENWIIEEVTSLPVTISSLKFATFCSPVNVTIPDGVQAYTATLSESKIVLEELVSKVIPANCGVLLYAEADEYDFTVGGEAEQVSGNRLIGTVAAIAAPANAYTLRKTAGKDECAFYAKEEGTTIGGFKSYIVSADGNSRLSFTFDGDDETGIGSIVNKKANGDGMYLIDGKIVIIKNGVKYNVNGIKF